MLPRGYITIFTLIVVSEIEHTNQVESVLEAKNLEQWEIKEEMK